MPYLVSLGENVPVTRQITLASRPIGLPTDENFTIKEVEVGEVAPGQVGVELVHISVDPYLRGRMNDAKSYVPPFSVGGPIQSGAIARVVSSRAEGIEEGDLLTGIFDWQESQVVNPAGYRKLDATGISPTAYLGILGMPGLTAYAGLFYIADAKEGETIFVSGAAGAVGSAVGQMAKIKGLTVIGSAGGPQKVSRLIELGFDKALDYRGGDIKAQLMDAAPDGIDIYFDNVGGDHLIAALEASNDFARFALCGSISEYNLTERSQGAWNLFRAVQRRIKLQGFIVTDFMDRSRGFYEEVVPWIQEGKLKFDETVVKGFENTPSAFLGLFSGSNTGKMIVTL
ncbi:MAG: NADP-dependent oxidoreductase [Actinomycetota bacterium]|nr:NADP-dependent oxidoreductase [Actinomycetota bacterium]